MEISQVCIKQASLETKTKLADDLCRLLQVREKNEGMIKDWLLYISTSSFKLTPGEIYLAFRMAMDGEILTQNGLAFELFPELSTITTSKILKSFIDQKKLNNDNYQKSKDKLKSLSQKTETTDSEKKEIRLKLLKLIFEELTETGVSDKTHLLFSELEQKGLIEISLEEKQQTYQSELKKYIPKEIEDIRTKRAMNSRTLLKDFNQRIEKNESIAAVQNICRQIYVNSFLKNYLSDFETFKSLFF